MEERTSLKLAISKLQAKVSEITKNSLHTEKMKKLLVNRELNNLSLNIRRKNYFMDIEDSDVAIVSNICTSSEDPVFKETLIPLLIGAEEKATYFES